MVKILWKALKQGCVLLFRLSYQGSFKFKNNLDEKTYDTLENNWERYAYDII